MTVADRIRIEREKLNLSQDELARKLGNKDKSTICKIEKSGNNITMKNIKRIADALGVSAQYLLGWEENSEELRHQIIYKESQLDIAQKEGNKENIDNIRKDLSLLYEEYKTKYDTYIELKETESDKTTEKALEMYEKYLNSDPNIRAAIENLLKGTQ